jgi:hypothetical protein
MNPIGGDTPCASTHSQLCCQHHLQATPMQRKLRPLIASMLAAWFFPNGTSSLAVETILACAYADVVQFCFKPQIEKLTDGIWLQVNANAKGFQVCHPFMDAERDAKLVQRQSQGQTCNSCPCHKYRQAASPVSLGQLTVADSLRLLNALVSAGV